jgi:hypothetical protein
MKSVFAGESLHERASNVEQLQVLVGSFHQTVVCDLGWATKVEKKKESSFYS